MAKSYRIEVDLNRCVGSTLCVHFAPGTFELDDEGQARVVGTPEDDDDVVMEAASQCPQSAIILRDAETGEQVFP